MNIRHVIDGTGSYDALSGLAFGFCGEHLNIRHTRLANAQLILEQDIGLLDTKSSIFIVQFLNRVYSSGF